MEQRKVKLTQIVVKRLFNSVDYDINVEREDSVTILIAPNGYGKTSILKILNAALNPCRESFNSARSVPFEEVTCVFDNGAAISISKVPMPDTSIRLRDNLEKSDFLILNFKRTLARYGLNFQIKYYVNNAFSSGVAAKYILDYTNPELLKAVDDDSFYLSPRGTISIINNLFEIHKDLIKRYIGDISLTFIDANRLRKKKNPKLASRRELLDDEYPATRSRERDREEEREEDPLVLASNDVQKETSEHLSQYNLKVKEALNNLPKAYISKGTGRPKGFDSFFPRWEKYLSRLQAMNEIGFIESKESTVGNVTKENYDSIGVFLDVYLDSFEHTLEPLEDIYNKYSSLKRIFDERAGSNALTKKRIQFTKEGIKVMLLDDSDQVIGELPITEMSSGEKNDFLMFYHLLFDTKPNSVVLIDEPEISLHIEWQESFIDSLTKICKLNDLTAIVTTHSPHIVNGHFDAIERLEK